MPVCSVRIPFTLQPPSNARSNPLDPRKIGNCQMNEVRNRCLTLKLARPRSEFQLNGFEDWLPNPLFPSFDSISMAFEKTYDPRTVKPPSKRRFQFTCKDW